MGVTKPVAVHINVFGTPAPQGSKKGFKKGNRVVVVDDNPKALRSWRGDVAAAASEAREQMQVQMHGPVQVSIQFRFRRPVSRPGSHHGWRDTKPDLDKLLRSTCDGLVEGGLLADDASIVGFNNVVKIEVTSWTGASITVAQLPPRESLL